MKFLGQPSSGSIAGTTFSHNRAGQYTRNRRAPVQPIGTGRRAAVRAAFAGASAAFSGLTTAQQDAWTSFAVSHPITDALGQSITLTGHQMFIRVQATLSNTGIPATTAPPSDTSPGNISPVTMTFSVATGISIAFNTGLISDVIAIAFSAPVSSGVRFNKTFWQPPGTDGYAPQLVSPVTLTTAKYAAQFGSPPIGRRVFVRVTPSSGDGFNGPGVITSAVVTA